MLTHESLANLYRSRKDDPVLSVYLDADEHDPTNRAAWRVRLENILAESEPTGDTDAAGSRQDFARAADLIKAELAQYDAFLPDRGWVGFATPDQLLHAESTRVPMPTVARFANGILVAPYVRALKQSRPVITVIADGQHARVFYYRDAQLARAAELESDTALGDLTDVGSPKRAATHSGTRGQTATDAARRYLDVGTERMIKKLAERVAELAGRSGLVLVGGTTETVPTIASRLSALGDRLTTDLSLHIGMSEAQVREATERAATELSTGLAGVRLEAMLDAARAGGLGCLGVTATEKALADRSVDALALSRRFIHEQPGHADALVGAALQQGAEVVELGDGPGELLDEEGQGVAAALRYRV